MNREVGFPGEAWASDIAIICLRSKGSSPLRRIFTPQTSHEGSWCQASIALVSGPALWFFSNSDQPLPM